MHLESRPAILYFGTPVVLISTENEDGSFNLAPMSSAWWLGWRCLLGLSTLSLTTQNLLRSRECVLNLPSVAEAEAVNRLARTTGSDPVPQAKLRRGYRHVADKFGLAGMTPMPSCQVTPPRVRECPIQLEAEVAHVQGIAETEVNLKGKHVAVEVAIRRVFVEDRLLLDGCTDKIDPDKWRPLVMSFQHFYGLALPRLQDSELAKIPEEAYRS